ncbi:MAG: hypothetical protein NTV48_00185 [Candidatus Vogelbacteria bacterium]|nr:hypothetical protein [Candidatus Vogelbacteria bacterium]
MKESVELSGLEAKREGLFERIENKIETIEELRAFAEANEALSAEDLEAECERQLELIKSKFPEKQEKFLDYQVLNKAMTDFRQEHHRDIPINFEEGVENIETDYSGIKMEEADKEREEIEEEWAIGENISELTKDPDVAFLVKVDTFFENLVKKRKEMVELQDFFHSDKEEFYNRVAKIVGLDNPAMIEEAELIWGGYDLTLLCESNLAEKIIIKGATGTHFVGSVINVVSKGKDWQGSANHESNHNLGEMFEDRGNFYSAVWIDRLSQSINRLNTFKTGPKSIDFIVQREKRMLREIISEYCHDNFNEIIADIDRIGEGEINTFLSNFRRALYGMEKIIEQIEDPEIKELAETSLNEAEEGFAEILKIVGNIFFASKELGDIDKAKASLILFETGRLDQAVKYMSWHFGSKFDFLYCLRPVLQGSAYFSVADNLRGRAIEQSGLVGILGRDGVYGRTQTFDFTLAEKTGLESFFELENIRQLAKTLEQDPSLKLAEEDKNKFEPLFDNPTPEVISDLDNDEFLELVKKIVFIAERLAIPELVSFVQERVAYQYFARSIYRSVDDGDFAEPLDLFMRWPFAKELLLEVLTHDGGGFIDEYLERQGIKPSIEELRETGIGKFYQAVGLGEMIDKYPIY